jgi:hypothetical protein
MKNSITCPHCKNTFDLEEIMIENIKNDFQAKYTQDKFALQSKLENDRQQLMDAMNIEKNKLEEDRQKMESYKEKEKELFEKKLKEQIQIRESILKEKLLLESNEKFKILELENEEKSKKLIEIEHIELKLRADKRKLEEQQQGMELELQRKMDEERKNIEERIRKSEQEQQSFKMQEKENLINNLKKQMEDMQRKVEQGSMQSQGEVQELALENLLQQTFIKDLIVPVAKGLNGADCSQIVRNNIHKDTGVILFESKRTKNFTDGWIEKLKQDMRNVKADIGILVTQVMPKDMQQFGLKDGIWICTFNDVVPLVTVLRDSIINIYEARESQLNTSEKTIQLYNYLTSNEFYLQITAIVEGFSNLKKSLDNEKKQMLKIWSEREKQIELVLNNTIYMYGNIKGIAGSSVKTIDELELGGNNLLEP